MGERRRRQSPLEVAIRGALVSIAKAQGIGEDRRLIEASTSDVLAAINSPRRWSHEAVQRVGLRARRGEIDLDLGEGLSMRYARGLFGVVLDGPSSEQRREMAWARLRELAALELRGDRQIGLGIDPDGEGLAQLQRCIGQALSKLESRERAAILEGLGRA